MSDKPLVFQELAALGFPTVIAQPQAVLDGRAIPFLFAGTLVNNQAFTLDTGATFLNLIAAAQRIDDRMTENFGSSDTPDANVLVTGIRVALEVGDLSKAEQEALFRGLVIKHRQNGKTRTIPLAGVAGAVLDAFGTDTTTAGAGRDRATRAARSVRLSTPFQLVMRTDAFGIGTRTAVNPSNRACWVELFGAAWKSTEFGTIERTEGDGKALLAARAQAAANARAADAIGAKLLAGTK